MRDLWLAGPEDPSEQAARFVAVARKRWGDVVTAANIKVE